MTTSFKALFKEAREHLDYWVGAAALELVGEIEREMEEQGVSRAELARRIGTSAAHVTQVLRGDGNFTLETMVKLARALGRDLRLHLAPEETVTLWRDVPFKLLRAEQSKTVLHMARFTEPVRDRPARREPLPGSEYPEGIKLSPVRLSAAVDSEEDADGSPPLAA